MIKFIYDNTGIKLIRTEDAIPKCGEDFCEDCGDCLVCYIEDGCGGNDSKPHYWVECLNDK